MQKYIFKIYNNFIFITMKDFKDHINEQIDEGFISDIFSFISRTFGIDRWMYRHNVGLFSRNRYSGGGFFGNPWGNITDPMKRRRMRKQWERAERERQRARELAERNAKRNKKGDESTTPKTTTSLITVDTIIELINSTGDCQLYRPDRYESTKLKWIKEHYKDEDHEFVPSPWFQKNVKNYADNDEFLLIKPTKNDLKYYTALDCIVRDGQIILPWDDEDIKDNDDELSVLMNDIVIPATYLAYNDQKGLENHIKRLQKQAEKEREKANKK